MRGLTVCRLVARVPGLQEHRAFAAEVASEGRTVSLASARSIFRLSGAEVIPFLQVNFNMSALEYLSCVVTCSV